MADFDRGATITGLRGMGGIGKTELALALAAKLKDRFPDGQIFLNMLGTSKIPLKPEDPMATISLAQSALAIFEQIESPHADAVRQVLVAWKS